MFRSALFEQLGENKLEGAVTRTFAEEGLPRHSPGCRGGGHDPKGSPEPKVATSIFFESNGGQARAEATIPEIRLAVAEPSLDIGNVETVVDALENACYFLSVDRNRYRFGLSANLNKLLADKRASIQQPRIDDRVRIEVQSVFSQGPPHRPYLLSGEEFTDPESGGSHYRGAPSENNDIDEAKTLQMVDSMTKQSGTSDRTSRALLFGVSRILAAALR